MLLGKKIKYIILVLSIAFLIYLSRSLFDEDNFVFLNQTYNENLVLNVSIDNQLCSYDKNSDTFYYSTSESNFRKWKIKLNSLYKLRYDILQTGDNQYEIKAFNNEYYENIKLIVTTLPIIDLQNLSFDSLFTLDTLPKVDISSILEDLDEEIDYETVEYFARFDDASRKPSKYENVGLKVRGASSILYPKKAYKMELKNKIEIFDLPKDDKFVLDALYVDKSKVRNLLASDIWNSINDNQTIQNDLNGEFVELFIDNEYVGLYVLKEKVDRSVTNISSDGLILKSTNHLYQRYIDSLLNLPNDYSPRDDSFLNFEIKQYDSDTFASFIGKLQRYYASYSYDSLSHSFDIDNYINYMIFVSLISGSDNVDYNYYLSMHDSNSNIFITPWDLDLTFGLNVWNIYWNDEIFENHINMESSSDIEWMNNNIIKNMDVKTFELMRKRYWKLRKNVISMDTINKYLDSYKKSIVDSGATLRDSDCWYYYDAEIEIEQIREWTKLRIEFLDEYFK